MAINQIEYNTLMQDKLDKRAVETASSGWMEENAGQVKYHGGNEVKIPTIATQGLADYDRDKGFVQGSVSVSYETYKMLQDRGRTFQLDAMDVDESNFIATSANVIRDFQDYHVIPEVDAYRYATIAKKSISLGNTEDYTVDPKTVIDKILEHISFVSDQVGVEEIIISLTSKAQLAINQSDKFQRFIDAGNFKKGGINLKVKSIDDNPLIKVPQDRMKTEILLKDGETGGQEVGGFEATDDAKDINWIICARKAPIAISKTDKLRVFEPNVNQKADAWKIDYRKYHGLWILKSRENQIFTCTAPKA